MINDSPPDAQISLMDFPASGSKMAGFAAASGVGSEAGLTGPGAFAVGASCATGLATTGGASDGASEGLSEQANKRVISKDIQTPLLYGFEAVYQK